MRFFFDNCISSNITAAMKLLNEPHHEIKHLKDLFPEATEDVDWLPELPKTPGLIIVSGDPAITTSKKEKEVWRSTGLTSFFFGGGFADLRFWTQAKIVVGWWPDIITAARESRPGIGYLLPMKGSKMQRIYDPYKLA